MKMRKIQVIDINCPNCGAPIDISEIKTNELQCSYCNSTITLKNRPRSKEKKVFQKNVETSNTNTGLSPTTSTRWATTSLILGFVSTIGVILPLCCLPINLAGLIAGIVGRHSPRKGLVVSGIVINSIGLIASITIGILGAIYGDPQV